jgi:hypothetical protein
LFHATIFFALALLSTNALENRRGHPQRTAGNGDQGMSRDPKPAADPACYRAEAISVVTEALSRLRYGTIQLTVHDGKVLQVDGTEKNRLGE